MRTILFWFDGAGDCRAASARYVTLAIPLLLFKLTAVYTVSINSGAERASVQAG